MSPLWLVLAAIAVWALIRLGRQGERAGRGHWRVTATLFSAVMIAGGVLALSRSSWVFGGGLVAAGLWLTVASRVRTVAPRAEGMSDGEARAILGVSADASRAQINAAWKKVMARAHPDQGGTAGLAARVNAARDHLLKR
ncbi:molecular chaperone DnaJ [Brevundimonas sp. FT23042]|uniref:molecular chaperone DnaJ n=1 Tax=Brevundimonas sp. FT23042 TaxID=3393749 RepID=UPI003B585B70